MWVWFSLLWLALPILAIVLATLTTLLTTLALRLFIPKANSPRRVFE